MKILTDDIAVHKVLMALYVVLSAGVEVVTAEEVRHIESFNQV